ncbi:9356_t:CDS:1, partial [Paraglomus brasilianum]
MDELYQTNQELRDELSRLAQSNRNIEKRVYTLERAIAIREERIRFLEEELDNTIELSRQEREEMTKKITNLKRIVHQLEKENIQKDKEIINKENLINEFDEREKKLKNRIREISKSAGNTPKAYTQTVKLIDENEHLKHEIDTLKYNLRDRDNKLAQKKTRITDLHCQNFALTLLRYRDRVELINTQETLQNAQIWNVENEYESDENSQDSYTSDPDMATIAELADTIDGYLDNPGTNRVILSNQIKRATRQIRRKYNNSQDDIIREQRARYDAEGERDLMQLAYQNEVKKHRRWYYSYKDKHRHVINLQRDKFTLHLLLQRYKRQINSCRTENGLLEYNRDRIFDRYEKWKNKTKDERQIILNQNQNILNLQQQNLALQNNNQQNQIMTTNQLPTYSGDENLEKFLAQFRAEVEARGINVADGAGAPTGRDVGKGLLRGCMRGRLLEWYDENITTKQNFELCNLLDNTGQATIQLVAGRTAVQI